MTIPPERPHQATWAFGAFRLLPAQGVLLEGNVDCRLRGRAIEILAALIERAGETVTKQELLARIWPDTMVHEANLRVHVAALRKALRDGQAGARYIDNVMGRGYCFVAPVQLVDMPDAATATVEDGRPHNLPALPPRLFGRAAAIEAITPRVPARRCVTVAGPGGIGKTALAVAVAERLLPIYDDGVWFVDFAVVSDAQLVVNAIASVLGVSVQATNPMAGLIAFLRDKRLLLLLDNCEHLVDAVAVTVEGIMRAAPHVGVLATSREPLRTGEEWVHRLEPLAIPPNGEALTAVEAAGFAAVQLFVESASVHVEGFELRDAEVDAVAEICHRLDGLPLAIELAAARIDLFGLRGLAAALRDPFLLLSEGRRTALPRQQSLLRTLEWSYQLLSPVEQTILGRLAVFKRDFTLDGAVAIAAGHGIEAEDVYVGVVTLSSKSLIATDVSTATPSHHHHLLHVTRAFVNQKPQCETAERKLVVRRHAEYMCQLLARAEKDWEEMDRAAWLDTYGRYIDDVRSALDWAFSADGDRSLGVILTAKALPLGFQLSRIEEFKARVERALLHGGSIQPSEAATEIGLNLALTRLNLGLGHLMHNTNGQTPGEPVGIDRAMEIAQQSDRFAHKAEPLVNLGTIHFYDGNYAAAVEAADQALSIARESGDAMALLAAERISAQARHFHGDHAGAEGHAQRVLGDPAFRLPLVHNLTPVDRRVVARIILARIAWLQGRLDVADEQVAQAMRLAKEDSAFSLCPALSFAAIPIAIWNGHDEEARSLTALLSEHSSRYTLYFWHGWAAAFNAALGARAGEVWSISDNSETQQLEVCATFSHELLTPAIAMRAERDGGGWCQAEIRRAQGAWILSEGASGCAAIAERLFRDALDISRRQGAFSWALRAATSLARLWQSDGRKTAAHALLSSTLERFETTNVTRDLSDAAALLKSLGTTRTIQNAAEAGGIARQPRVRKRRSRARR